MTVTVIPRRRGPHLRLLDVGQDLGEVADLLETAFGAEMDESGLRMLRELRRMARMSRFLGRWLGIPLGWGTSLVAFVWEEEGRIVGHAMAMRMDYAGVRWQISNVAVAPAYRGRGIGRALMETTLEELRRRRARWAVLQVRVNNPPAVHLYRSLGFETVGGEIHWERHGWPRPENLLDAPRLPFTPLKFTRNPELRQLIQRSLSDPGRWWYLNAHVQPPEPPGAWLRRLLGWRRSEAWGYREKGRLVAHVGFTYDRWTDRGTLGLHVDRAHWGQLEAALVAWAQERAAHVGVSHLFTHTELEYSAMTEALEQAGFDARHRLFNMRLAL